VVVAVGQPNIALSAWPPLAAKTPEFEQTPVAMLPLLVVRVRGSRQGHGTNALPSRLVSGGGRRTSSHARKYTVQTFQGLNKQMSKMGVLRQLKIQARLQDRDPWIDLYTRL